MLGWLLVERGEDVHQQLARMPSKRLPSKRPVETTQTALQLLDAPVSPSRLMDLEVRRREQKERKHLLDVEWAEKMAEMLEKDQENARRWVELKEGWEVERREAGLKRDMRMTEVIARRDAIEKQFQGEAERVEEEVGGGKSVERIQCEAARKYVKIKSQLEHLSEKMSMTKHWSKEGASEPSSARKMIEPSPRKMIEPENEKEESGSDDERIKDITASRLQMLYDHYVKDKPTLGVEI